ncbi:MAG: hypothetical protein QOE73_2318 [Verrucomicrobiota bacterium]
MTTGPRPSYGINRIKCKTDNVYLMEAIESLT